VEKIPTFGREIEFAHRFHGQKSNELNVSLLLVSSKTRAKRKVDGLIGNYECALKLTRRFFFCYPISFSFPSPRSDRSSALGCVCSEGLAGSNNVWVLNVYLYSF